MSEQPVCMKMMLGAYCQSSHAALLKHAAGSRLMHVHKVISWLFSRQLITRSNWNCY